MQRYLGPILIAVVIFFGVNLVMGSSTGTNLIDIARGDVTPSAAPVFTDPPAEPSEPAGEPEMPAEEPTAPEQPAELSSAAQAALQALDGIDVTPATRIPAYNRKEQFTPGGKGTSWPDIAGTGCNTRDDILAAQLTNVVRNEKCQVVTGTLDDPYTGNVIDFERDVTVNGKKVGGNSMAVQIDHKYPLKKFWEGGAWKWTLEERVAAANDPLNLVASDGPANNFKSAKGPSEWMPSTSGNAAYDCTFATDVVTVLVKYDLTATKADIASLRSTLTTCA